MTAFVPGGTNRTWEDVLNIFDCTSGSAQSMKIPPRDDILKLQWLKWDVWASLYGVGHNLPKGWKFEAVTYTSTMQYFAVASPNDEALAKPVETFYGNMEALFTSMVGTPNNNPVAQPWTFTRAYDALNGTKNLLTEQATALGKVRDKVGKKGDDFQGTGAGAFWEVLDNLMFRCTDLGNQLGDRPAGLKKLRAPTDDAATVGINEAELVLRWAFDNLTQAYKKWQSTTETATYDISLFGPVSAAGYHFSTPAGALAAIWTSDRFTQDLKDNKAEDDKVTVFEHYPRCDFLDADARNPVFWEKIVTAAKELWTKHITTVLDSAASSVLTELPRVYGETKLLLPTILEPHRPNLHKKPPPTGGQDGSKPPPTPPPPPPPPGPPKTKVPPPPGGKDGPPNTKDTKGNGGKVPPFDKNNPPGPNNPHNPDKPPPKPPPGLPSPETQLKVPIGSSVGLDGVVRGPDKKPVLDPFGRQIVVPRGSTVSPNGEILGPKGEKLAEKDRLSRPEPTNQDTKKQSELDQYLKTLRGTNAPSMPTLLNNTHSPPLSLSSSGPQTLHSGSSGPAPHPGPTGLNGGGRPETTATPPPGKPVTTEGGPSLIKNQQGNGASQNGMGGVPFYPPTAGGPGGGAGGDQNKGERDRTTWLAEDEETWGTDPKLPPSVLGARRRGRRVAGSGAGGSRNYGQGGNDGRLAGGSTSPGYGHAEGSA
ncbi:collagen adhesion protein [Amycolatopsis coloradensis]|uniref:Collagen adhesion protein n=2 Tax=Amycolatopsis coloradensis TaxID=76021 RepID=A0A1R0KI87_9PSEU|nr:collagen adhesion protein [Amycolatopsis coloradensis]